MVTIASVYGSLPHQRPVSDTPLDQWLRARSISRLQFAKTIEVTPRTVHLWCNNQVLPDLVNAFRIQAATDFGVTPDMWMGTELARFLYRHDKADFTNARTQKRKDNRKHYIKRIKHAKATGSP